MKQLQISQLSQMAMAEPKQTPGVMWGQTDENGTDPRWVDREALSWDTESSFFPFAGSKTLRSGQVQFPTVKVNPKLACSSEVGWGGC